MDAFKLLTRGTTLYQSREKSTAQRVPSAGSAASPRIFSKPLPNEDSRAEGPTRKRKRNERSSKSEPTAQVSVVINNRTSEGKHDLDEIGWSDENEQRHDSEDVLKFSDDCNSLEKRQQLLNQHKLKIVLLGNATLKKTLSSGDRVLHTRDTQKATVSRIYPLPLMSFKDLPLRYHVSKRLMENLYNQGFEIPTEVQAGSLPLLLGDDTDQEPPEAGQRILSQYKSIDLLTVAPTGSGKTLAFLIPAIQGLLKLLHDPIVEPKTDCVRALILAPTHELVNQIVIEGKKLIAGTGVRIAGMQKGSYIEQEDDKDFHSAQYTSVVKSDIVVSTPLMLVHSLQEGERTRALPSIRFLILDEADVLLDPLFKDQTLAVWTECVNSKLRVSLWSATMGSSVENLARKFITERQMSVGTDPNEHALARLIVGLKDSSLPSIDHKLVYAGSEPGKLLGLRELLHPSTAASWDQLPPVRPPFLVFTQTIERARALHAELLYDIPAEAGGASRIAVLHSELSDRARADVMTNFRKGELWIIITTDLLSRGIDFRGINGVVNYDIPTSAAAYVHRAGRTGRAGREGGIAVTFYTKEDIPYVKNIANVIAATEKAHGTSSDGFGEGVQRWLLDALPRVGRSTKEDLKQRGVAARRSFAKRSERTKEARRARISTRSGYDRDIQNRRRGAIQKSKRLHSSAAVDLETIEDEWAGFDD